MTATHLRQHSLTLAKYRELFPEAPLKCLALVEATRNQLVAITSTPEWRAKQSARMKGSKNSFHGRKHTEEVRAVMSERQLQMRRDGLLTTPENFRTYLQRNSLVDENRFEEGGCKKIDRQKSLRAYGHACLVCGFSEAVHNHHILGSKVSRKVADMIILCPNHHALADAGKLSVEYLTNLAHEVRHKS